MSHAPGIRARLAQLVLASALPAVLIAAALLGIEHRRDRETLERDALATARALGHAVAREQASIATAAQVLATSQRVRSGDFAAFRAQAEEVVAARIGMNVVLSDREGRQLLNTLRAPGTALPPHGDPGQLREVLESGRPAFSNLYTGGVLARPVVSVDVPVVRDGKVAYVLSVGELPERFQAMLHQQKLPPEWIGVVFDATGTVVARTHEPERFVGSKAPIDALARMAAEPEGTFEFVTLEGIPAVSVFSRAAPTGWTAAIGIPSASLSKVAWQRTQAALVAAAVVIAIGLALAWAIGGSIARSLAGLVAPAVQLGGKVPVRVPPLGLREADEVGAALERASELLFAAEHRAQHDTLTGLANRALFLDMARRQLERCKRDGTRLAVLFVDLDNFKHVNDAHGHEAGDRLLCAVAERLQGSVRASDVAARLGGDEFAVLLGHADAALAAAVASKLVDALAAPYDLDGLALRMSASIGVAAYPEAGEDAEALVKRADEAMYKAKVGGKRGHAMA